MASHTVLQEKLRAVLNGSATFESLEVTAETDTTSVELAFRSLLADLLRRKNDVDVLIKLVKTSMDVATSVPAHVAVPYLLLEDLVDFLTVAQSRSLFDFMQENTRVWMKEPFAKPSQTRLLKICNALMRKLSKSQDRAFNGRILMFLASMFPLTDKSGVNLRSSFNTGNTTEYLPAIPEGIFENESDSTLYKQFWSLQKFFNDPSICYTKASWAEFILNSAAVLERFEKSKLEGASAAHAESSVEETYFAKFLTSPKLFKLQLGDCNFRRQVLVQFLVLFQYLEVPTRFKKKEMVLSKPQVEWVVACRARINQIIKDMPPSGDHFLKAIQLFLKRELGWIQWKNENCYEFEKEPRKRPQDSEISSAGPSQRPKFDLGTEELSRLWSLSKSNMDGCATGSGQVPKIDEFFEESLEQIDPANDIDKEYWSICDPSFRWRALRLLAKSKLHFFQEFTKRGDKSFANMTDYLEFVIRRMAEEKAGGAHAQAPAGEDTAAAAGEDAPQQAEPDAATEAETDATAATEPEPMVS